MTALMLEPTATAQWQALVNEAETRCARQLDETLESYLVFLLMRFTGRSGLAASVLALDFLEGLMAPLRQRHERLREVGDQCLLYSGLFPRRAARRHVRVSYYVDMGRAAYGRLAEDHTPANALLYTQLAHGFVALMEVLQAMVRRTDAPTLELIHSVELWHDTGSSRALSQWRSPADVPANTGRNQKSH